MTQQFAATVELIRGSLDIANIQSQCRVFARLSFETVSIPAVIFLQHLLAVFFLGAQ